VGVSVTKKENKMITVEKIIEIIASTGVVKDMSKFDPDKSLNDNGIDS
jgi:hypothetical protein